MGSRLLVDTRFDVRAEAGGRDPDRFSKMLRVYHQLLWSKPLPGGAVFDLDATLRHTNDVGNFRLSSDTIAATYLRWGAAAPRRRRPTGSARRGERLLRPGVHGGRVPRLPAGSPQRRGKVRTQSTRPAASTPGSAIVSTSPSSPSDATTWAPSAPWPTSSPGIATSSTSSATSAGTSTTSSSTTWSRRTTDR